MGASRDQILKALRDAARPVGEAPELRASPLRFEDPLAAFQENLAAAGGECGAPVAAEHLDEALRQLPVVGAAERLLSALPGLASRPDPPPDDPRALDGLDLAVLPGGCAVAESGAVWVVPADARQRAALFLAESVVLVAPRTGLVHTLHEAYARIGVPARPFGCFVSGPSKTADIEQSLVIGAHGPRWLQVLLVDGDFPGMRVS